MAIRDVIVRPSRAHLKARGAGCMTHIDEQPGGGDVNTTRFRFGGKGLGGGCDWILPIQRLGGGSGDRRPKVCYDV